MSSHLENICLEVVGMEKKCRYQERMHQTYGYPQITGGICPELFHAAYPYSLGLLYDARFDSGDCPGGKDQDSAVVRCPRGGIILEVRRIGTLPKPLKNLKALAEKFSEKFLDYPIDKIDCKIRFKIISSDGSCICGHKVGEEYWLNIWDKCLMCPATFDAVYSAMCRVSAGIRDEELVACQDYEGITYKITRKK
ncbi:MAG: hypothetical protein ABH950_03505 [Candidatus Altiarchaeota archaeon]